MGPEQTREAERRRSDRFAIEREIRYRALNKRGGEEAGEGKTVNMSSSGVLFTSGQILRPGRRIELAISWPAQLNNKCALKLVARGRIVRFENGRGRHGNSAIRVPYAVGAGGRLDRWARQDGRRV